jgi:hypothetical protein
MSEITQAGATSTGMPLTAALPEATSTKAPGARMLLFTPACSCAIESRVPGREWPQPCGSDERRFGNAMVYLHYRTVT